MSGWSSGPCQRLGLRLVSHPEIFPGNILTSKELVRSLTYSLIAGFSAHCSRWSPPTLSPEKDSYCANLSILPAILPAALPGIFLGIGYSISFTRPPLDLYGTAAIIILSMIFWNISTGYQRASVPCSRFPLIQRSREQSGATSMRIFREIEIPLIKAPFLLRVIVSFIRPSPP